MLYGLSNVGKGADSLYLGFTGDGTTVAVNPIRDTSFASDPGLYYTIGNKSTQLSAMALRVGGSHMSALKVGTSPLLGLTEGKGKLIVNGVKGGKVPKYLKDNMGKTSLSTQLGIGVGKQPGSGVKKIEKPSGFPFKGSVSSIEGAEKSVEINNPVLDNIRTGSALKGDAQHAFNDIIDNYVGDATKFSLQGGDGVNRVLYQLEGSLNGKKGIFEWIVDPDPTKGVIHRRFIENAGITGKPNAKP